MQTQDLEWTVGSVHITRIEERITAVAWDGLAPGAAEWVESCRPWIDPFVSGSGSHLLLSVHSFVVQTPDTLIVVDTCVGSNPNARLPSDPTFGDRLAAALPGGIDAVDIVVCTHLHFDHVGWNTIERDGIMVPTFPNARYLITEDELAADRDNEDAGAYALSIEPLKTAGCLDPVQSDHRIDPWVTLVPSPGHTPGHVSLRISNDNGTEAGQALITGDMVHTPIQLAHPEVSSTPDHNKAQATQTRRQFVDELANTDVLVLGTHFAPPTAGHITRTGDSVRFE